MDEDALAFKAVAPWRGLAKDGQLEKTAVTAGAAKSYMPFVRVDFKEGLIWKGHADKARKICGLNAGLRLPLLDIVVRCFRRRLQPWGLPNDQGAFGKPLAGRLCSRGGRSEYHNSSL